MNKIFKTIAKATPVILVLTLFCSNPVKDVAWRTSIDLPITSNKKFILAAMMDTLFFNKHQVLTTTSYDTIKVPGKPDSIAKIIDTTIMIMKAYPLYDSSVKPARVILDTVAFGFPYEKDTSYAITKDTMKDKYFSDAFGPIPLSGTPVETLTIPLPTGAYPAVVSIPAVPVTVKWVNEIDLMDTGQTLNVTVTNNSAVNFSSVQITLGSLGTQTISNLAADSSGVAHFTPNGKVINGTTNVSVTITPAAAGTFAAGNNLQVMFSLEGLTAQKVDVIDSLLANYERIFTNAYNLTDTVNVDYIDIKEGFFTYSVSNYTGMDLLLTVIHRNLWITSFCQLYKPHPLDSIQALTGLTSQDSAYSNCGVARLSSFAAHTTNTYEKLNLSASRLFPEWDPSDSQSVSKIDYHVTVGPFNGKKVVLSAGDSLSFVIRSTKFKFSEMKGSCMIPYQRTSNLSTIPVNLPWSKAVTDSLRNNFILQKVLAQVRTNIGMPRGAFLDTVHVTYEIASVTDPTAKCDSSTVLTHVDTDAVFFRSIDITKLVNTYPDSINVKMSLKVDSGTVIRLENDLTTADSAYNKYLGRMMLHGHFNYNLVAPLWWTVADTTVMDLGGTRVDLGGASGVLDFIEKMRDRHDSLNIKVTNFTNVDLKLYALIATDTSKIAALVDTNNAGYISTNDFTALINNPPLNGGFVNLLGSGLWIPPRDSTHSVENTVVISDANLDKLVKAKKIGMRWEVRFIPHPVSATSPVPDALSNTDWLRLNSWIHIDGVNCIDSLIQ